MGIMLTAVFIIVCLNPLFIFGFGWGVRGSAFATITGQCVALVLEFTHFLNRKHFLYLKRGTFRFIGTIVRKVLSIGMAPFLLNVCASIVVIFINNALKKTGGDISIGAYGIVNRVLMLFVMIVNGLNQGMQPIVGYNYGARQFDRVIRTLKLNIVCAVCVTTFGFILGHFFPHLVAGMFTDDPTLLSVAEMGLKISLLAFPIAGFQIVSSGFFQYIGKPQKAILLSLTRQLLFSSRCWPSCPTFTAPWAYGRACPSPTASRHSSPGCSSFSRYARCAGIRTKSRSSDFSAPLRYK